MGGKATEKLWDQTAIAQNCGEIVDIVEQVSPTILPAQSRTSYKLLYLLTCSDKLASYMKLSFIYTTKRMSDIFHTRVSLFTLFVLGMVM